MNWLRGTETGSEHFDERGRFVPEHLPEPDAFLDGYDVLREDRHVRVHGMAHEGFEEFGVYDTTFGYNLATLNRDRRHPSAGFRYAEDGDELRVTFTPTTEFCPQGDALAIGAFRAWNRSDVHEYSIVRVRVHEMHHTSDSTNARLAALEADYEATGTIDPDPSGQP